ncbi:zinc-binding metallopeptidase [Marinifilum flexuosum]|uniref:Substrate import-associated zinc metallohydrolase lipoprotein n=1 Tax=Marinifilum flexuosum TaxID=1117708 RepID=A0A419WTG1_9BACT|nr:putative zinc-binding metallopeptidase [Marinifilum flexuosum]RKD98761.1 substrate import-associated zinc metallohydrolase lipoprotein [Marinifilum flexuosum]
MKKYICFLMLGVLFFSSCSSDEDLGESLIDTSTPELNEVDEWIRENYTYPYNVEVKYKWDNSELDNTKILTPTTLDRVIPFLEKMKEIWVDPYARNGGEDFMKAYIPKQMVLVGSHNYEDNGGIVLGQAEGGRKITIFDLNYIDFDLSGLNSWEKRRAMEPILRVFKTMHHEFGHILHQTIAYPVEYKKLTTGYTSNWMNFSNSEARGMGFITAYSLLNPDEDFVEMLSEFLTRSNEDWNELIDKIKVYDENYYTDEDASKLARIKIREKEKMIADYMLQIWKIDIYKLQADIAEVLDGLSN